MFLSSSQYKCRTADPNWQNLSRSGKLSFFTIYNFWQNFASVRQVLDLILKTVEVCDEWQADSHEIKKE